MACMKTVMLHTIVLVVGVFAAILTGNTAVSASSAAWDDSTRMRVETTTFAMPCNWETITVYGHEIVSTSIYDLVDVERCVVHGKDMDVAYANIDSSGLPYGLLVRLHGYNVFALVQEYDSFGYGRVASYYQLDFVANTNKLFFTSSRWPYSVEQPLVIDDMAAALSPLYYYGEDVHNVLRYGLSADTPIRKVLSEPLYATSNVKSYKTSQDGKFMIAYVDDEGIIKVDSAVGATTKLLVLPYDSWSGNNRPTIHAISPDGRYVLIGPKGIILDTKNCGDSQFGRIHRSQPILHPCTTTDISDLIANEIGFSPYLRMARFTDDNSIEATVSDGFYSEDRQRIIIHAGVEEASEGLDYLALGDSFSSGEGDLDRDKNGNKYYRRGTDIKGDKDTPREKCHLSTNSYPYHLALGMELGAPTTDSNATKWQSVACSGATTWDIKERGSGDYSGQNDDTNKPRLEGYDVASLKSTALNEFIPGRQKQIEFVKKYQPKVITLTMGGNDINFGGKMQECVSRLSTCSYATSEWRTNLKNEIYGQFDNLSSLYGELRNATDGQSKIYVIGYPVYINADPDAKCSNKLLFLNLEEREMVVNSIIYLNNIIEAAAKNAGVTYVDIEHAFGNHRLCDDGESHVNAVAGIAGYGGNELQESFHPNKKGHEDMTSAIWDFVGGASLLDYVTCPGSGQQRATCPNTSIDANNAAMPPYFLDGDESDRNTIVRYYTLTNGVLMKSVKHNGLKTGESWFEPESKVDVTLYSTPTYLGQFTTDQDGNLHADITIPASVPAGYHRLSIAGIASDGRPIEVYQTVLVQGSNGSDVDEDGVPDKYDRCIYSLPVDDTVDITNDAGCLALSGDVGARSVGPSMINDQISNFRQSTTLADKLSDDTILSQYIQKPNSNFHTKAHIDQPTAKITDSTTLVTLVSTIVLVFVLPVLYAKSRKL